MQIAIYEDTGFSSAPPCKVVPLGGLAQTRKTQIYTRKNWYYESWHSVSSQCDKTQKHHQISENIPLACGAVYLCQYVITKIRVLCHKNFHIDLKKFTIYKLGSVYCKVSLFDTAGYNVEMRKYLVLLTKQVVNTCSFKSILI